MRESHADADRTNLVTVSLTPARNELDCTRHKPAQKLHQFLSSMPSAQRYGPLAKISRLIVSFVTLLSIATWCVSRLKLIVIAGLPFILSWVMAVPALPCEPPPAPSSAGDPSHTYRRR
jgi:hypothetical protein